MLVNGSERETLCDREFQIAFLLACGLRPREIQKRLGISRCTLRNHIDNACSVLGLSGRSQLAMWCIRETGIYKDQQLKEAA